MRYEHDTSHARKDRQKKSGEKAETAGRGERVVKHFIRTRKRKRQQGREKERGEETHGGEHEVKAQKSTSVKVNY